MAYSHDEILDADANEEQTTLPIVTDDGETIEQDDLDSIVEEILTEWDSLSPDGETPESYRDAWEEYLTFGDNPE